MSQHLRKVGVRLPGKGISNFHGARPGHLIITMIKWIRTSRLSIKKSLSARFWRSCSGSRARCSQPLIPKSLSPNAGLAERGCSRRSTLSLRPSTSSCTRRSLIRPVPGRFWRNCSGSRARCRNPSLPLSSSTRYIPNPATYTPNLTLFLSLAHGPRARRVQGLGCSGSEAGSYLRLIDFVYHSTLGLRVIKKKKKVQVLEFGRLRRRVTGVPRSSATAPH